MAERIAPRDPMAALRRATAALKVFPLHGVVVLPGTPAPFHVFEPRYKALVAKMVSMVFFASGSGNNLKMILVITPRVPSEPQRSRVRS